MRMHWEEIHTSSQSLGLNKQRRTECQISEQNKTENQDNE